MDWKLNMGLGWAMQGTRFPLAPFVAAPQELQATPDCRHPGALASAPYIILVLFEYN